MSSKNPLMDSNPQNDKKRDLNFVVTKFMTKGYNALNEEELAVTLVNPDFNPIFKKQTGKQNRPFFSNFGDFE